MLPSGFEDCVKSVFAKHPAALDSRSDETVINVMRAASLPIHGTRGEMMHRLRVKSKLEAPNHPCIFCVADQPHPGSLLDLADGYVTKWSTTKQRHYWANATDSTFDRQVQSESAGAGAVVCAPPISA